MKVLTAFLIGLVFGTGIILSGMANPAKVLNFFDVAGSWDPSLAFVMGGALMVAFVGFRLLKSRTAPLLAASFQWPTRQDIDPPLVAGAGLFGIGWGIAGFCPGGALPALGTGRLEVYIFMVAAVVGIAMATLLTTRRKTAGDPGKPGSETA